MITILAGCVSGLGYIVLRNFFNGFAPGTHASCFYLCNATLAGPVAVAACCDQIEVYYGLVIAAIGCVLYCAGSKLLIKCEIDDPTEAFLVYGAQGFWAVLAPGFFHRQKGLFYTGEGTQLGVQLGGALVLILFSAAVAVAMFTMIKVQRRFRIGAIYEVVGLDALIEADDGDDLLPREALEKIEMKQRLATEAAGKSKRAFP